MAELRGVSSNDGKVALFFQETGDRCGVRVTLQVGDKALTAVLGPAAWDRLCDRYGGPLSAIVCEAQPNEMTADAFQELKQELEQARNAVDFYRKQAGEFTEGQRTTARAPLLEENQTLREQCAARDARIVQLQAELMALQDVNPNRTRRSFEP